MHPRYIFHGIVNSQFIRILKLCKEPHILAHEADRLESLFLERGYPVKMVRKVRQSIIGDIGSQCHSSVIINYANTTLHKERYLYPIRTLENRIRFTIKYTSDIAYLREIFSRNWNILIMDSQTKKLVGDKPSFLYKNSENLKLTLCNDSHILSNSTSGLNQESGTYACNHCNRCQYITKNQIYRHPNNNFVFTPNFHATCDTMNLVYLANCSLCQAFYVGLTKRKLQERIYNHLYDINKGSETNALAKHIQEFTLHTFCFRVLQVVRINPRGGDSYNNLSIIELNWILKLGAHLPPGLNHVLSIKPILQQKS